MESAREWRMAAACDAAAIAQPYGGHDGTRVPWLFANGQDPNCAAIAERRAAREHVRSTREYNARHRTALFGRWDHGRAVDGDGTHRQTVSRDHARSVV